MVILLGGSSHVGKTLVAQRLMARLGFPYISLDHLKMGFIRSGMTTLTVNDDWKMRYWMWPFVAEVVKTAIENHQNLIVEGCYIPTTGRTVSQHNSIAQNPTISHLQRPIPLNQALVPLTTCPISAVLSSS